MSTETSVVSTLESMERNGNRHEPRTRLLVLLSAAMGACGNEDDPPAIPEAGGSSDGHADPDASRSPGTGPSGIDSSAMNQVPPSRPCLPSSGPGPSPTLRGSRPSAMRLSCAHDRENPVDDGGTSNRGSCREMAAL